MPIQYSSNRLAAQSEGTSNVRLSKAPLISTADLHIAVDLREMVSLHCKLPVPG